MRVSPLKFNNCLSYPQNFTGRSEEIKRADCLMRKAKQTFPMLSATYVDDFYEVTRKGSSKKKKADEISQGLWDKIFVLRRSCDEAEKYSQYSMFDTKSMYDLSQKFKNSACCALCKRVLQFFPCKFIL